MIDSFRKVLGQPGSDRLEVLLELCSHGSSMNADTVLGFASQAQELAIRRHDREHTLLAGFYIAECYNVKGHADTCLELSDRALKELSDTDRYFYLYRDFTWNTIVSLTKLRRIPESIHACYSLLSGGERNGDVAARIIACNCLGVNNNILENRPEAISWVQKAYSLFEASATESPAFPQYDYVGGLVCINLSAMYFYRHSNDSGFYYLRRAYALAKKAQDLKIESDCYTLEGEVYLEGNHTDSAALMLNRSLDIQKKIGSVQNILVVLDAMETFYAGQKDYSRAISCIRQEQWYARKFDEPLVFQAYRDLASYYRALKNYTAYGETMDTLMMLKDSLYQKSKAEDLAKLEAQYELTSKEAFIARQKLELLHKNIWIAGVAVFLLVLVAGGFLTYRHIRRKQKIELDVAEEKERKRIAADLHDNIGAYASAISDHIDDMENRKLISDDASLQHLKQNAAEIISSLRDTIWAFNRDAITLTGISDRLKIYLQKIRPSYPGVVISLEEQITGERKLSPAQALHTFRILQEAIHNALRHSGADRIVVQVTADDHSMDLGVRDNGRGLDPLANRETGNGLSNMNRRAAEAGFALSISRADPKGTLVRLMAPGK